MNLSKLKRLKNLEDNDIPTYAILIHNNYILIPKVKYPRIFRKLEMIYEEKAMEYASLKRSIKQCVDVKTKEEMFNNLLKIKYTIGL